MGSYVIAGWAFIGVRVTEPALGKASVSDMVRINNGYCVNHG